MTQDRSHRDATGAEISRPERRGAWFPSALCALLIAWALFVQIAFLRAGGSLASGVVHSLSTLGLGLLSATAFFVLGWRIVRRVDPAEPDDGPTRAPLERSLIELGVGISALMLAILLLCSLGMLLPEFGVALLLTPFVGAPSLYRDLFADLRARFDVAREVTGPGLSISWALFGIVALLTLLESLTPARSQDALVYHLAVPARYIAEGQIHHVPGNFYASFPQNVDMLFVLGLLLEGDVLAKWFHWMLAIASSLTVVALSRAVVTRSTVAGERSHPRGLAAALFATVPTAALISTWAYVDLGVVFFTLLSLLCFVRFWQRQHGAAVDGLRHPSTRWLGLAALFAGITAGCKYTGASQIVFIVVGVAVFALTEKRRFPVAAKQVLFAGGLASLVVAPWLVKNIVFTGNPLHPFAYSLFGGKDWDAARSAILSYSLGEWGGMRTSWDLARLPWDVTIHGEFFSQERFDGVIGGAFLIGLPLILLGLRGSREYRIVSIFGLLYGLTWVATTHQIRFLLPALAVAAALIAASVGELRRVLHRRIASGVLCVALLANVVLVVNHFAAHNPLPVLLGQESRHDFLARELPGGDYSVFRFIEDELPEDSRILFGSCGNPGFLCKRDYHSDALFENFTLSALLERSEDPEDFLEQMRAHGFTHLLFKLSYVFDPEGRKSEIPKEGQAVLGRFLNQYAKLLVTANGTCLFEVRPTAVTRRSEMR